VNKDFGIQIEGYKEKSNACLALKEKCVLL
jgi:hypothetical protein